MVAGVVVIIASLAVAIEKHRAKYTIERGTVLEKIYHPQSEQCDIVMIPGMDGSVSFSPIYSTTPEQFALKVRGLNAAEEWVTTSVIVSKSEYDTLSVGDKWHK